jgi:hypothetical protein
MSLLKSTGMSCSNSMTRGIKKIKKHAQTEEDHSKGLPKAVIANLMDDPVYFLCERFNCYMKKIRCIERQDMRGAPWLSPGSSSGDQLIRFLECQNCKQGEMIRAGNESDRTAGSSGQQCN